MVIVGVASGILQADSQPGSYGLVWGSAAAWWRSIFTYEPSELSQWIWYDDSTINIIVVITIIIIIIIIFECTSDSLMTHGM